VDDILRTKEAAKYLKVGEAYIRQLIRLKKLRAYREGRRGGYRILKEDINKYIKQKLTSNKVLD
jgi:excisionase family DNA binding protein